jgi:hypothetical protein
VSSRDAILACWALVAAVFIGCQVLSVLSRRRFQGAQGLLDGVTSRTWSFALLFVGWMWLGWHFFAR